MSKRFKNENQSSLFNHTKESEKMEFRPSVERYEGAFLWSAIGDALGWPTEYLGSIERGKLPFEIPLKEYVQWKKPVGGRWWGYIDTIQPGEYSDDTQLTLSVARCINDSGSFEPERFAYSELPLWLHYQRGGGRSVKTAARRILRVKTDWSSNFYRAKNLDYRQSGANGAAMRTLPIILASLNNERRTISDSFYNAIITHGHPRAILGAILFSYAVRYALSDNNIETGMIEYLLDSLKNSLLITEEDKYIHRWVKTWDANSQKSNGAFSSLYKETIGEIYTNLCEIPYYLDKPDNEYYSLIGAFEPSTKGSGVGTVCCAVYLFFKYEQIPEEAIYSAVNLLGSDTDTIAVFLGSMLGARFGRKSIPTHLYTLLQDREYLEKTANRLYSISQGDTFERISHSENMRKKEAYLNILAWETGLQEMFWDAIGEGGCIVHPALGRGLIIEKAVKPIRRRDYVAKLLKVRFDCGQTCVFHSRMHKNGSISESLAPQVMIQLKKLS